MRSDIEQAIVVLRQGDDKAVERALTLLQNTIFSFSMKVCGHREDAEDTSQEVLLKSIPQLPKFDSPKALLVWLYKVAKTRCLMSRRNSKFAPREKLSLDQLMPDRKELLQLRDGSINPEMFSIRSEEAGRLRAAIQKLPPPYRIVLVLSDMEGLTDEEVAEITGLRSGTLRVRLHRARLFVRKELMKNWKPPHRVEPPSTAMSNTEDLQRPHRCRQMFAELSDYLDEQLDDSLCIALEKHLDGCGPCKVFLASLESTIQECRKFPPERLPKKKTAQLSKKLAENYKRAAAALKARS